MSPKLQPKLYNDLNEAKWKFDLSYIMKRIVKRFKASWIRYIFIFIFALKTIFSQYTTYNNNLFHVISAETTSV